jgi:hypothetical protein
MDPEPCIEFAKCAAEVWFVWWLVGWAPSPLDLVRSLVDLCRAAPDPNEVERREVERLELLARAAELRRKLDH